MPPGAPYVEGLTFCQPAWSLGFTLQANSHPFSFTFLPSSLKPRIEKGRKFCVLFRGAVLPGFLQKRVIAEPWWDYFEIPGLPSKMNPLPGLGRTPLPAPPAGILIFPIHGQASSFAEQKSSTPTGGSLTASEANDGHNHFQRYRFHLGRDLRKQHSTP